MNMNPAPPPTLSKEFSRVWIGWCMIGDREVAREAAAKGVYISLALQFIATRKEWDHSDVERWFKSEILAWVYQLLEQKQIFKACHILSNIGIDAIEQLSNILTDSTNKHVRDYIAEHLLKNGKLDVELLNSWKFITAIEKYNSLTFNKIWDDISNISIAKIDNKSVEWKANIATVLFFNTYDFCLENFLSPEFAWNNLLLNEKLDVLKIWINVYFSKDLNYTCNHSLTDDVFVKLKNIFLLWEITDTMINGVKRQLLSSKLIAVDFVLNELSKFGIFTEDERKNVPNILSRFSRTQNIPHLLEILQEPTSFLTMREFYEHFNLFCVQHELYEVLTECSKLEINCSIKQTKELTLWLKRKQTIGEKLNEENIRRNIILAVKYFAENRQQYFQENLNPLLLIAIVIFTRDQFLSEILMDKLSIRVDDDFLVSYEDFMRSVKQLPVFEKVFEKFTSNSGLRLDFYALIRKYSGLRNGVFDFRVNSSEMPNCDNQALTSRYGIVKEIDCTFYVRQNRPSVAAKKLLLANGENMDLIVQRTLEMALKKFEVMPSCIAFLEMIGKPTDELRVVVNAANTVHNSGLVSKQSAIELFSDIKAHAQTILDLLERSAMQSYDASLVESNLMNVLKDYELPVSFAKIEQLKYPEVFLNCCTEHNHWLQFLVFVQHFSYPVEQVLKLSMDFGNKEIMEHLYHALSTDIDFEDEPDVANAFTTSVTSIDYEANLNESLVDFTTRSNLLKILIKCHKSGDPPTALLQATQTYRHPLLAILATCYEPDSVVTNWLAWLSISTNIKMDIIENYSVSPNAVASLLESALKNRYARTLLEGFEIFLPDNPLYCLAEFLYDCVELNFETSIDKLKTFERIINQLSFNTSIPSIDFEYTFLTNGYWLIDTALKLIFAVLGNCFRTRAHQIQFLNILCGAKFLQNMPPLECPNFCAISKLLEALSSSVYLNLGEFLCVEARRKEIVKRIEHLIAKKQYRDALALAKFENICKEYVLNEEWLYRFLESPNVQFWDNCEKAFENAEILPSSAAIFYVLCCSNLNDDSDKYKALKLAYKWLKLSDYSEQFVENVEQEIWSNYFALSDETLNTSTFSKHETNYLLTEIEDRSQTHSRFDNHLNSIQVRHLEEAIGKILESGDVVEAVRLNKMFDHKNQEIEILLTCYELAEGRLKPYEISAEQRLLVLNRDMNLKTVPHRRRTVKSRMSSVSSVSHDSQTIVPISEQEESKHDTLTLLETMTDRLNHGSNIASRILMCYRISVNTNQPYHDVVKHSDSMSLLRESLLQDCKNKLEVIHDVFVIFKWTKSDITNFIFDELIAAINKSLAENLESVEMWDLNLDQQFHLVLQLCSESNSILGKKILSLINSPHKESEIHVVVELLVRAHDCFNSFCNMEGISSVLRKAQAISLNLVNEKNWKVMVRLLTGIGRYTEMNYIFQILKENDQFEYLLKKNYRENNGLKVALFKFLEKHCPKNQELYRIVALHFKLFSEVAELWQNEALEMINNLIEIAKLEVQNQGRNMDAVDFLLFTNNESTKLCLNKAMMNYTHAAEYHLHGEKLNGAMQAARQAELVALQINLLINTGANMTCKCILKLNAAQINQIISSELSFSQTKILTESYNFQVDWGLILFKQSVLNAKLDYLDEFMSMKPLTNTLAQDLTRRFLAVAEKNLSEASVRAMKEILNKLDSVHMKYRLASELGFSDVIETLLSGTQLAFLKDTVWKRGYKQL